MLLKKIDCPVRSVPVFIVLSLLMACFSTSAFAFKLPDTGQTKCYQGVSPFAEIPCGGTGQDGAYNTNPMRFTVVGTNSDMVQDNNTGLIWQRYENARPYNWYEASGTYDATNNPSSQNVCSSLNLGNSSDWRLPSKKELITILDYSIPNPGPAINMTYFPNIESSLYWSSTTDAYNPNYAWPVYFSNGGFGGGDYDLGTHFYKSAWYLNVRCVRSGQYTAHNFTDNGNGTVTDNTTGLIWQQDDPGGLTWASALSYCEGLPLGGHSDWRLPNIKELESITDDTRYNPAVDTVFFPNAHSSIYWSSTTYDGSSSDAWYIGFSYGYSSARDKNYYSFYVRCVSGGRSGPLGYTALPATVYGLQTYSGHSKDPVNTSTGNYVYNKKDIEIPGNGLSLTFQRNYNSQDAVDGPLGFGWDHTYNSTLAINVDSTVTVRWGDGKIQTWTPNGSGGYTPQYGVFDTLINNGDGTYTLNKKDLTEYYFNTSGKLSSIIDKNSNMISLTYTGLNLTQITDTVERDIDLTYDGNNRITAITDPIGRTVQFTYDTNGNLETATDMNGYITTYTYDTNHQMLTVVDPRDNTVVTNTYDNQNRVVTSQRDAKMGQTTYTYDTQNRITTIVDQMGFTTIHYHDQLRRLIQETDALGNSTYYTYDAAGNRTRVQDKKGNITTYTYDTSGNVLTKTDALNNITTITYDSNNNPLTRTDALGNTTTFEYDANGNLTKTTDPLGNFTTVTYDTDGLPLSSTDARGNTSTYAHDAEGNVIESVDALGNKTTYTYDGVGRRLTAKDALNKITTYTYDDNNNLLTATEPLGGVNSYTYDENNNKISVTDPMGSVTSYAYDVKDLLTTVTDPFGNTINSTYDALDRKISVRDKRGNITAYAYNAVGNLISATDSLGNTTIYTYDANGNRLTETNPLGQTTTYAYDALDRVTSVTDPLGNTTVNTYDAIGRVIATTNAIAQTTNFHYDAMGRLTTVMDSNGGVVTYTYDANGNRLTMTDPNGNTTSYVYDAINRLTQKVEPLGSAYQYGYDAVGNRISHTDAKGDTVTYAYDANRRLAGINYPDSSAVNFTYDANGNKTQMFDSLGTSLYTYDQLNRLTNYRDPFGKTVGYGYDANGNRTSIVYPYGNPVNYSYDSLNRLISVTDWLSKTTAYTYDTTGKLIGTSNPNGTTAAYSYDSAGRMIGLTNAKSDTAVISSWGYTLDAIGNHISVASNEPLVPIITNKNITYTYDAENRLTNTGSTPNIFDANGNMTARGADTFIYDYSNRLIQSNVGGVIAQYSYDGLGNRLMKTEGGLSTQYILDINGRLSNVLAETNGSPNISAYYVYGLGLISNILPDGTAYYYHYDSRGSTVALTDGSQNITDAYSYNSFGNMLNSNGSTPNPFKYVGRYGLMDEGNGLEFVRARYYAPDLGRFITKDPLTGKDGDSQSLNRYVYALNNPVRLIDISGFSALEGKVLGTSTESSDIMHNGVIEPKQSWLEKHPLIVKIGSTVVSIVEKIPLLNLFGASTGGGSGIPMGPTDALTYSELIYETAHTEVAVMKNQNQNLDDYVGLLQDGCSVSEVVTYIRSANYFPGYSNDALRAKIINRVNDLGINLTSEQLK
jgi:RHS repeat-associated protein